MGLYPDHLLKRASLILEEARRKKLMLATAESCTGGLIAGCLTEVPGSSEVFDRGFISYSYDAKMAQLSVDRKTIADFGAVSAETALEMAEGALRASHAHIALAVTGIAGPGGATPDKPVGLVYLAVANGKTGKTRTIKNVYGGDRPAVRLATVETALEELVAEIESI
jgi:nicotinamide-nucleotide amidase